jgi:isochorismate synthase EntC
VADSDGAREWAESRMKLRPMLTALGLDPDDTEAVP